MSDRLTGGELLQIEAWFAVNGAIGSLDRIMLLRRHIAVLETELQAAQAVVEAALKWRQAENALCVESCSTDGVTPELVALDNKVHAAKTDFLAALAAYDEKEKQDAQ